MLRKQSYTYLEKYHSQYYPDLSQKKKSSSQEAKLPYYMHYQTSQDQKDRYHYNIERYQEINEPIEDLADLKIDPNFIDPTNNFKDIFIKREEYKPVILPDGSIEPDMTTLKIQEKKSKIMQKVGQALLSYFTSPPHTKLPQNGAEFLRDMQESDDFHSQKAKNSSKIQEKMDSTKIRTIGNLTWYIYNNKLYNIEYTFLSESQKEELGIDSQIVNGKSIHHQVNNSIYLKNVHNVLKNLDREQEDDYNYYGDLYSSQNDKQESERFDFDLRMEVFSSDLSIYKYIYLQENFFKTNNDKINCNIYEVYNQKRRTFNRNIDCAKLRQKREDKLTREQNPYPKDYYDPDGLQSDYNDEDRDAELHYKWGCIVNENEEEIQCAINSQPKSYNHFLNVYQLPQMELLSSTPLNFNVIDYNSRFVLYNEDRFYLIRNKEVVVYYRVDRQWKRKLVYTTLQNSPSYLFATFNPCDQTDLLIEANYRVSLGQNNAILIIANELKRLQTGNEQQINIKKIQRGSNNLLVVIYEFEISKDKNKTKFEKVVLFDVLKNDFLYDTVYYHPKVHKDQNFLIEGFVCSRTMDQDEMLFVNLQNYQNPIQLDSIYNKDQTNVLENAFALFQSDTTGQIIVSYKKVSPIFNDRGNKIKNPTIFQTYIIDTLNNHHQVYTFPRQELSVHQSSYFNNRSHMLFRSVKDDFIMNLHIGEPLPTQFFTEFNENQTGIKPSQQLTIHPDSSITLYTESDYFSKKFEMQFQVKNGQIFPFLKRDSYLFCENSIINDAKNMDYYFLQADKFYVWDFKVLKNLVILEKHQSKNYKRRSEAPPAAKCFISLDQIEQITMLKFNTNPPLTHAFIVDQDMQGRLYRMDSREENVTMFQYSIEILNKILYIISHENNEIYLLTENYQTKDHYLEYYKYGRSSMKLIKSFHLSYIHPYWDLIKTRIKRIRSESEVFKNSQNQIETKSEETLKAQKNSYLSDIYQLISSSIIYKDFVLVHYSNTILIFKQQTLEFLGSYEFNFQVLSFTIIDDNVYIHSTKNFDNLHLQDGLFQSLVRLNPSKMHVKVNLFEMTLEFLDSTLEVIGYFNFNQIDNQLKLQQLLKINIKEQKFLSEIEKLKIDQISCYLGSDYNKYDGTFLHWLVEKSQTAFQVVNAKIQKQNLEQLPVLFQKNIQGFTPFDYARQKGDTLILIQLLDMAVKYQNSIYYNYCIDPHLMYFLKNGIILKDYLESNLPIQKITDKNYPLYSTDADTYLHADFNQNFSINKILQVHNEIFKGVLKENTEKTSIQIEYYLVNLPETMKQPEFIKYLSWQSNLEIFDQLVIRTIIDFKFFRYTRGYFMYFFVYFLVFLNNFFLIIVIDISDAIPDYIGIMHGGMLLLIFVKLCQNLRIFQGFSFLVSMLQAVFVDIKFFILLYIFVIIIYGLIFTLLKIQTDAENLEYKGLGYFGYIVMAFRASTGDFQVDEFSNLEEKHIIYAWIIWIAGILFLNIILLNFIIAVISESYDKVMQKVIQDFNYIKNQDFPNLQKFIQESYRIKAQLIKERELMLTKYDFDNLYNYPNYVILRRPAQSAAEDELDWQGFVKDIKKTLNKATENQFNKTKEQIDIIKQIYKVKDSLLTQMQDGIYKQIYYIKFKKSILIINIASYKDHKEKMIRQLQRVEAQIE